MKLIDLTGKSFGRLTVLSRGTGPGVKVHWDCECECGTRVTVLGHKLKSGHTKSCGCLVIETAKKNFLLASEGNVTHRLSYHPLYRTWKNMLARCLNPDHRAYHNYGGRGISVFPDWLTGPTEYIGWIEENIGPKKKGKSIDRIDNDGNYEPGNLRWATARDQLLNRRS